MTILVVAAAYGDNKKINRDLLNLVDKLAQFHLLITLPDSKVVRLVVMS